jgi:hypothetical protein
MRFVIWNVTIIVNISKRINKQIQHRSDWKELVLLNHFSILIRILVATYRLFPTGQIRLVS